MADWDRDCSQKHGRRFCIGQFGEQFHFDDDVGLKSDLSVELSGICASLGF